MSVEGKNTILSAEETMNKSPKQKRNVEMKAVVVLVAAVLLSTAIIGYMYFSQDPTGEEGIEDSVYVIVIGKDGTEENISLSQMMEMAQTSGVSSVQNRFNNTRDQGYYSGVELSELVDSVGGMAEDDVLSVRSEDGYEVLLGYQNVYPSGDILDIQGYSVLAYSLDNISAPEWEDGPRLIFMPDSGIHTNQNATAATPEGIEPPVSAGAMWARSVSIIEIL